MITPSKERPALLAELLRALGRRGARGCVTPTNAAPIPRATRGAADYDASFMPSHRATRLTLCFLTALHAGCSTQIVDPMDAASTTDAAFPDVPDTTTSTLPGRTFVIEVAPYSNAWWLNAIAYDADASPAACTRRVSGACTVTDCRGARLPDAGFLPQPHAGEIQAYAMSGGDTARIDPTESGLYGFFPNAARVADPRPTVYVTALGGTIPAFSAGLAVPAPLTVTTPRAAEPLEIDRASGLPIAWNAIDETVVVTLVQSAIGGGGGIGIESIWMQCAFDGRSAGAVVPPDALADFAAQPMATPMGATLIVQSQTLDQLRSGGFIVTIGVGNGGVVTFPTFR